MWFRAGAAQAGFWALRGQQILSRVFKETLERGGFWGIKFPQAVSDLFRACGRAASQRGAGSAGAVGGAYGACAGALRRRLSKFKAAGPFPSESGAAAVELEFRPV